MVDVDPSEMNLERLEPGDRITRDGSHTMLKTMVLVRKEIPEMELERLEQARNELTNAILDGNTSVANAASLAMLNAEIAQRS